MTEQSTASFSLSGRVALVTGGGSGIGVGIAAVLAEAGATVVIADRDEAAAEKEVATLTKAGHRAGAVHIDLADETSIVRGCAEIIATYGTPWVLVNNAGLQDRELLLEGTAAQWDRMNAVNGRGPYLMTREVARAMAAQGQGGRIVNIASAALVGCMVKGGGPYAASKGALLALSRASALELVEHRITVNTVLPGGVMTPGAFAAKGPAPEGPGCRPPPLGFSEPRDIAAAVLFFATPAARFVTNQVIAVDAGWSLT
ncbi:MAG: SDR family oxidoreductase [Rhodospirillaceae bacterium]|nr:MAG: SDR family oxidoreductase [Rhodospirillaceae bacterium]